MLPHSIYLSLLDCLVVIINSAHNSDYILDKIFDIEAQNTTDRKKDIWTGGRTGLC